MLPVTASELLASQQRIEKPRRIGSIQKQPLRRRRASWPNIKATDRLMTFLRGGGEEARNLRGTRFQLKRMQGSGHVGKSAAAAMPSACKKSLLLSARRNAPFSSLHCSISAGIRKFAVLERNIFLITDFYYSAFAWHSYGSHFADVALKRKMQEKWKMKLNYWIARSIQNHDEAHPADSRRSTLGVQ